ncbi:MAG TPA: hypothetical protein VMX16_14100 [Terriglobia bacterium]|nr:hypothetical protein [Terriglobia bacterium]
MTKRQRDLLIRLINDPPVGSKIAAAKEFGIDLTLLVRRLEMTPTERLQELEAAQSFVQELQRARKLEP